MVRTSDLKSEDPGSIPGVSKTYSDNGRPHFTIVVIIFKFGDF